MLLLILWLENVKVEIKFYIAVESILNFSGGTMGAMICFILPASIMLRSDAVSAKSLNRNLVGLSWVSYLMLMKEKSLIW
jgi:hypothetical protein